MTDEERFADWQRFIKASYSETIQVFWNRKLFRAVRVMFQTNTELMARGNHVWEWVAGMYARDAAMLVRRELDKQNKVVNLRNLLHDIERNIAVLHTLSQATGLPSAEHVRKDREKLENETAKVRDYAERLLAHRTESLQATVTFGELDRALKVVVHMMRAYYAYLTAADLLFATPVPQFNWLAPFSMPWLPAEFQEPEDDEELPE